MTRSILLVLARDAYAAHVYSAVYSAAGFPSVGHALIIETAEQMESGLFSVVMDFEYLRNKDS